MCSFPATAPKHYCCAACRNESNFRWADNSTAPASVVSSFQDYAGPGYAHWAKYMANGPVTAEPQNWGNDNESCVVAAQPKEFGYPAYYYFSGATKADRVGVERLLLALSVPFNKRIQRKPLLATPGAVQLHRDGHQLRPVWLGGHPLRAVCIRSLRV